MATVASTRAQGLSALAEQKKREKAILLKATILMIDSFVDSLAERLENPNKTLLGKPAALSEGDTEFTKCSGAIRSVIGNTLGYRSAFSKPVPPQYEKLRKIFDKSLYASNPKDKYPEPRIEFLYRFKLLFSQLQPGGGIGECTKYKRVLNLLQDKTTDGKKFNYSNLYENLYDAIKPIDNAIERKEIDEAAQMALESAALESVQAMPLPPIRTNISASTSARPATIEEPEPVISEDDIRAATSTTSAAPAGQTQLTEADQLEILKIKTALMSPRYKDNPLIKLLISNDEDLRRVAEKIYRRRQTGKSRRTYRKKKHHRRTRKVRRS